MTTQWSGAWLFCSRLRHFVFWSSCTTSILFMMSYFLSVDAVLKHEGQMLQNGRHRSCDVSAGSMLEVMV
jgi:hypothetical protein